MFIQVITTGGTIDKEYFDALSRYNVGEPQVSEILRYANVQAEHAVEALFRKDSLELDDDDREVIRDRVLASPHERILVTHGTDTMVDTARVLSTVPGKTIVLVGSLTPARFRFTDAEFNIGFAFGVVQLAPHGVWLAMNGSIFRHDRVVKNRDANRFEAR
jgi:L-asparaginase